MLTVRKSVKVCSHNLANFPAILSSVKGMNINFVLMLLTSLLFLLFPGLGAKKGRDDYWIQHQDSFDQLLANLNAQQTTATTKTAHCHSNEEISPTKTLIDSAAESKRLM